MYQDDQSWVPTKRAVGFILEDGAGAEYGTANFIDRDERRDEGVEFCEPHQMEETWLLNPPRAPVVAIEPTQVELDDQSCITIDTTTSGRDVLFTPPGPSLPASPWQAHLDRQDQQTNQPNSRLSNVTKNATHISAIVEDYISPSSLSDFSKRHDSGRHLTWDTGENGILVEDSIKHSPTSMSQTPANMSTLDSGPANLTHREADLMQHFTRKLALWMDCCDPDCQFAQEVPKRAVHMPMLLNAALALSSRHQSLMTGGNAFETTHYYRRCVELVIRELSKPTYDDNLCATIVCMCVYEELDDKVEAFLQLVCAGRMLQVIPTFAHSGGLAEAASWQALRQDVYVSLRNKVQPSLDLDKYGSSRAFDFRDDGTCANAILLLFARLLRLLHSRPKSPLYDDWKEMEHHAEQWDAQRSLIFQPLFVKEADMNGGLTFPAIRVSNSAQGKNSFSSRKDQILSL